MGETVRTASGAACSSPGRSSSGPDIMVLDESFGALDPESLRRYLEVVLEEPAALVAIAHP